MRKTELKEIAACFCTACVSDISICRLGIGIINDTYLVESSETKFVLQRISERVFPDPLAVIDNFQTVTEHLSNASTDNSGLLQFALPVPTRGGCLCYRDPRGSYWRAQQFIDHVRVDSLGSYNQAYSVGAVLGVFHSLMEDVNVENLADPLPGYHNLPLYLEEYDQVMSQPVSSSTDELIYCHRLVSTHRQRGNTLEQAKHDGVLSLQPIHGDPKIDNFFFDSGGKATGLFDLDTVGKGLIHYDIGDCLRSCCNRAGENGRQQSRVCFDLEICKPLLYGYFSKAQKLFSKEQADYIFDSILLVSYELGLRFFTDYLRGNQYFLVEEEDENLLRAIKQFQLVEDIASKEVRIRSLIAKAQDL